MSDELGELYATRAALASLVQSPGWKLLLASASEERDAILKVFCTPLASMDEAPAQEFSKGRAYQLSWLASAPQALIDNLTVEIESIVQQEKTNGSGDFSDHADGDDTSSSAGGGDIAP